MIAEAKLLKIDLLNSKASQVHTNKGMVNRPKAENYLLGIHEADKEKEGDILLLLNVHPEKKQVPTLQILKRHLKD